VVPKIKAKGNVSKKELNHHEYVKHPEKFQDRSNLYSGTMKGSTLMKSNKWTNQVYGGTKI